jgi:hypothetical protein
LILSNLELIAHPQSKQLPPLSWLTTLSSPVFILLYRESTSTNNIK